MLDNNLSLILKGGGEIIVSGEDRVGVQSDTPWLDCEGSREWNIDVGEVLARHSTGKFFCYNAMFVIGKWGTGYGEEDGVKLQIPVANVVAVLNSKPAHC